MTTPTLTITGAIVRLDECKLDPFRPSRYSNAEHHDISLRITVETEDGTYWFYTPAVDRWISCPPGCPIAVFGQDGNDWIEEMSGHADRNGQKQTGGGHKVKVGQKITVTGRVKRASTKWGTQLNYVKLVSVLAAELAQV